ncbi:hypothetical protein LO772_08520 [Yinghuangia sp. ASG 101]|uniref:hypothetical protein n=1 Tax=Yinghuangia sp. ASG 101 TaxID=2896848 RepID=UPI001E3CCE69|nr:hypothetical protein [Yinghuangia sp. ASG 101]UGQ13629.1 hypothetical protein LO772_08520 [Yinghuangia sp. ASG 101]
MTTERVPRQSDPTADGPAPTAPHRAPGAADAVTATDTAAIPAPASPPDTRAGTVRSPAPTRPAETATTTYLVVAGDALVVGKQPDGDSVRFRPQDPEVLRQLANGDRIEPGKDGSVQLRLDGIDAPELHFAGHSQPLADRSRDVFLRLLGFDEVSYAANHMTVTAAQPATVPGVIVARMAEAYGRPVAFLFTGDAADELRGHHGTRIEVDRTRLSASANVRLLASGDAYPLLYTSTSPELRAAVRAVAEGARDAGVGVYAVDTTARFGVADHDAIGPDGDLVLPKLFRRVTDWLRATKDASTTEKSRTRATRKPTFPAWLRADPDRNDHVHVDGATRGQTLDTLLRQKGNTVTMEADPLSLVFVER